MASSTKALTVLALVVGPAMAFLIPRDTNFSLVTIPLTNIGNQQYTAPIQMVSLH